MSISKIGLTGKIVSLCLTIVTLGAGVAGYGVYTTSLVADNYEHVAKINLPNADALGGMLSFQKDAYLHFLLWEENGKSAEMKKEVLGFMEEYEKKDAWYQSIPFVAGEEEIYQPVAKSWKVFKAAVENNLNENKKSDLMPLHEEFGKNLTRLIKFQGEQGKTWSTLASDLRNKAFYLQILSLSALLLISFLLSVFLGRSISKTVRAIALQLSEGADQVHAASSQVSTSSNSLSHSTTDQAASLEETAAALEEISTMISKASDGAKTTASTSTESQNRAEEGSKAVGQMIHSMDEISQSNDAIMTQISQSNQKMAEIVNVIKNIGEKTKVINDIVFQTKLLSFNASVEAARAGEHGKGFAVVAEEVGKLAQMSGNAAKEITEMLDSSIATVESIVDETQRGVEGLVAQGKLKVASGVETAKKCSDVLGEIVKNVGVVAELAQGISIASREQAQGVEEINKAMTQLDAVTQQNAATSEEASSAAEELSAQAETLKGVVRELLRTIEGGEALPTEGSATSRDAAQRFQSKKSNVVPLKIVKKSEDMHEFKKAAVGQDGFQDI